MYETIKHIISAAPIRSIWNIFSMSDACVGLAFSGVVKKINTTIAARPPIGRLIQKH